MPERVKNAFKAVANRMYFTAFLSGLTQNQSSWVQPFMQAVLVFTEDITGKDAIKFSQWLPAHWERHANKTW